MENICIVYSTGRKIRYRFFSMEVYEKGRMDGFIQGIRDLTWWEKLLVRVLGVI